MCRKAHSQHHRRRECQHWTSASQNWTSVPGGRLAGTPAVLVSGKCIQGWGRWGRCGTGQERGGLGPGRGGETGGGFPCLILCSASDWTANIRSFQPAKWPVPSQIHPLQGQGFTWDKGTNIPFPRGDSGSMYF